MASNQPNAKRQKITVKTKLAILNYLDTPGASIRKATQKFKLSKKVFQGAKEYNPELRSHCNRNLNL